jgi:Porphobilinogen deaminase, C-terminal domain
VRLAAERSFLATLDGSCETPIAGLAVIEGDQLWLRGEILRPDGSEAIDGQARGAITDAAALGHDLATRLLSQAPKDFFSWHWYSAVVARIDDIMPEDTATLPQDVTFAVTNTALNNRLKRARVTYPPSDDQGFDLPRGVPEAVSASVVPLFCFEYCKCRVGGPSPRRRFAHRYDVRLLPFLFTLLASLSIRVRQSHDQTCVSVLSAMPTTFQTPQDKEHWSFCL